MPARAHRTPLTAEQWGAIDAAWLAGDSAGAIATSLQMSHRRICRAVELLGHEIAPRRWTLEKRRTKEQKRTRKSTYDRDRLIDYKKQVFDHYGALCVCCGEDTILFLTIDHINDDGAEHRRNMTQANIHEAIVKAGFPDSFRIMCLNCNRGRWLNGGVCPHETPAWAGFNRKG